MTDKWCLEQTNQQLIQELAQGGWMVKTSGRWTTKVLNQIAWFPSILRGCSLFITGGSEDFWKMPSTNLAAPTLCILGQEKWPPLILGTNEVTLLSQNMKRKLKSWFTPVGRLKYLWLKWLQVQLKGPYGVRRAKPPRILQDLNFNNV